MKKILIVFITISFVSLKCQAQEDGTIYNFPKGKFSILTFDTISEIENEDDKKYTFRINFSHDEMNYLMSSTKHINNLDADIDELLNVSLSSFNEKIKGEIKEEKEIYLNDVKGKYALISLNEDTLKFEYYIYMKGNYQYQLVIYAETEFYSNKEAELVLSSLVLITE